ncbi:MAG: peptide MFS transporter [Chitinophagaceae bacterium]|jgi:POT family proton-dependent oligopeptide transporter|nr:peptide MFS transporter [Chitinophagaceae bacterium]
MSQVSSETTLRHPKGLFVLFFTEMWERFSYYGMRAIFTLYMTKALFLDKSEASNIYGSYTGLVYLTPLIGGYVADKYWGNRKSILFGGILMAVGQFLMFFSASNYQNTGLATILMWFGLSGLIIGNGFFKPNISTMVGQLYPRGDKRLDAAFTLFYMGINLGAFFSPIVCGILGDTGNPADFKYGFLAAGIGMVFGVISFEFMKKKYLVTPEGEAVGDIANKKREVKQEDIAGNIGKISQTSMIIWGVIGVALILLFHYLMAQDWIGSVIFSISIVAPGLILTDTSLTKIERERIIVIFVAAFFVIFFWAAFEQAGASLTFFADEQMDRVVNINTNYGNLYLIVAALAGLLYYTLQRIMDIPKEFKILFYGVGIYLLYLVISGYVKGEVFALKEIPASAYNSVNAVFIVILAPLFAELWGKLGVRNLEPASPYKQALGLLFLSLGYVVIAIGVSDIGTVKVSMMWLIVLYLLHTIGELCLSPIGLSLVNKLAPVRFASLLMGTWFLANATANKFAGTLSSFYPDGGKATSFLGYKMENIFDFFVLFIVMSGAASLILFVLSKKLLKMMHGIK